MGRKKVQIKFIEKQRKRDITLRKRARGVLKKLKEFAILTGSHGEIIFYNSDKTKQISISTNNMCDDSVSNNTIGNIIDTIKIDNILLDEKRNNFEELYDNNEFYSYFSDYTDEMISNYIAKIMGIE